MTPQQILGVLSAVTPIITAVLVGWGLDNEVAGLMAGGVIMIIAGALSLVFNRPAAQAISVAKNEDVKVVVGAGASAEMRSLAEDPQRPNIVQSSSVDEMGMLMRDPRIAGRR